MEGKEATAHLYRSKQPSSDIASLLSSIERSVHEAVELAVTQNTKHSKRKSSKVRSSDGASRMSNDIKSILRSSAEAVVGILSTQRLTEEDAESARDLLGHIKTLLMEVDSHSENVYKLTDVLKPQRAGDGNETESTVSSASASEGAAARVLKRHRKADTSPVGTHEAASDDHTSRRSSSPPKKDEKGEETGIIAVSPPPRTKVAPRNSLKPETSGKQNNDVATARADRLESLLKRTEEVLERHLTHEAAQSAERTSIATSMAIARANESNRTIHQRPTYLSNLDTRVQPLRSSAAVFDGGSRLRSSGVGESLKTPVIASASNVRAAEDSASAQDLLLEHLNSSVAPADESVAHVMGAASDAVELARLRGELAVCRQRVSTAQAEAEHARASRDETERALLEEKRVRQQLQFDVASAQQKVSTQSEQISSFQERLTALQKALASAHADMDVAAAAARQREQEGLQAARDDLQKAVQQERQHQESLRQQAIDSLREEMESLKQESHNALKLAKEENESVKRELQKSKQETADVRGELERLDGVLNESQTTLVRVRTEVVTLNARIAAAHSMAAGKDDVITSLREQVRQLEDDNRQLQTTHEEEKTALEMQISELGAMLSAMEERAFQAEGKVSEGDSLSKQLEDTIARLRSDLEDVRADNTTLRTESVALREEAHKMAAELETKLASSEGKILALQDTIDEATRKEKVLRETLTETQSALQVSVSRRDAIELQLREVEQSAAEEKSSYMQEINELRRQNDELHRETLKLQDSAGDLQRELSSVHDSHVSEVARLRESLSLMERQLEEANRVKDELSKAAKRDAQDANLSIKDLQENIHELEEEISSLKEANNRLSSELGRAETAHRVASDRLAAVTAEVEMLNATVNGERVAAEQALEDADAEIMRLSKALARASEERTQLEVVAEELQQALTLSESRRQEELDAADNAARDDADLALQKLAELEGKHKEAVERAAEVEAALAAVQTDLKSAVDASRADKRRIESLEVRLKDTEERLVKITRERDDAVRRASDSVAKVSADSSSIVASLREEVSASKADLMRQNIKVESFQRQIREQELSMQELQSRLSEHAVEVSKLQRQVDVTVTERDDARRQLNAIQKERDALMQQIRALSSDVARLNALNSSLASNSLNAESASKERQDALAHALSAVEQEKHAIHEVVQRSEAEKRDAELRAQQLEASVRQLAAELAFYRAKDEARAGLTETRDQVRSHSHSFSNHATKSSILRAVSPSRALAAASNKPFASSLGSSSNTSTSATRLDVTFKSGGDMDAPTAVKAVPPPTPAAELRKTLSSPASPAHPAAVPSFRDQYLARRNSPHPTARSNNRLLPKSPSGILRETISSSMKRTNTAAPSSARESIRE